MELKLSAFCYDLPRVTHPQRPRERNIQQQFPFDGQSTGDRATLSSLLSKLELPTESALVFSSRPVICPLASEDACNLNSLSIL